MTSTPSADFAEFMSRRLTASTAFVNGDIEPLHRLSALTSPVTIFGPQGDTVVGTDEVNAANARPADRFDPGATNVFDVSHQSADEHLRLLGRIQRSVIRMGGNDQPIPMNLRVTGIFRREPAGWMLIHRHADPLKDEAS